MISRTLLTGTPAVSKAATCAAAAALGVVIAVTVTPRVIAPRLVAPRIRLGVARVEVFEVVLHLPVDAPPDGLLILGVESLAVVHFIQNLCAKDGKGA